MSETLREFDLKMKGYYNNNINININSPNESMLMRYLRSGTPSDHDFSSSPNRSRPIVKPHKSGSSTTSSKSPLSTVKSLEDDVLVMDGILVDSNKASKSSGKFRSSANSDSSPNSGTNLYKTEVCVSWENTGSCRYGYKCQFAHGKEELRPPNHGRSKIKSDYVIVDPYYSPQSSTSSNSSKLAADTMSASSSGTKEEALAKFSKLEIQQKKNAPTSSPKVATSSNSSKLAADTMSTSSSAARDAALSKFKKLAIQQPMDPMSLRRKIFSAAGWSPLDDGITPTTSSDETFTRNDVDDYIDRLLYGPAEKKRLAVFVDICPE